jgi:CRP/FNR family transcriptional regulator, cyclic AMP receptor protein
MMRLLGTEHTFSDRFISHMLTRNIRIDDQPQGLLPKVSQETLAEMIGTTRSRVNFFCE